MRPYVQFNSIGQICGTAGWTVQSRVVSRCDEKESVRRRGLAGFAAVAGGEHFGRPVDRRACRADFDERADDRAHHVVEEAVAGDVDRDAIGSTSAVRAVTADSDLRATRLRGASRSARESCESNRAARSRPFRSWRNRVGRRAPALPRASRRHRAVADSARRSGDRTRDGDAAVVDVVAIALADGVVRGVKSFGASSIVTTAMSFGSSALRPRCKSSFESRVSVDKPTTWPSAWTPASVRPAAVTRSVSCVSRCQVASSVPCTVGLSG